MTVYRDENDKIGTVPGEFSWLRFGIMVALLALLALAWFLT